eukprot:scaffold7378_cov410-Prasinococcus_capsulatus_cf.AAC.17
MVAAVGTRRRGARLGAFLLERAGDLRGGVEDAPGGGPDVVGEGDAHARLGHVVAAQEAVAAPGLLALAALLHAVQVVPREAPRLKNAQLGGRLQRVPRVHHIRAELGELARVARAGEPSVQRRLVGDRGQAHVLRPRGGHTREKLGHELLVPESHRHHDAPHVRRRSVRLSFRCAEDDAVPLLQVRLRMLRDGFRAGIVVGQLLLPHLAVAQACQFATRHDALHRIGEAEAARLLGLQRRGVAQARRELGLGGDELLLVAPRARVLRLHGGRLGNGVPVGNALLQARLLPAHAGH